MLSPGGYIVRSRHWISLLAIFSVFLHAGVLVRHSAMMLERALLTGELAAGLGVICHSDRSMSQVDRTVPALPENGGGTMDCPYCHGAMATAALLPSPILIPAPAHSPSLRVAALTELIARRLSALRPPPRGPPDLI